MNVEITYESSRKTQMFVGGFPPKTSIDELMQLFTRYGKVYDIVLERDSKRKNQAKNCKGSAKITMSEELCEMILNKKFLQLKGRKIRCTRCLQGDELTQYLKNLNQRRILLSNLVPRHNQVALTDYFSQFGDLENCYRIDQYGIDKAKDKGFLIFNNVEHAAKVLLNSTHIICGQPVLCELKRQNLLSKKVLKRKLKNKKKRKRKKRKGRLSDPISTQEKKKAQRTQNSQNFEEFGNEKEQFVLTQSRKNLESSKVLQRQKMDRSTHSLRKLSDILRNRPNNKMYLRNIERNHRCRNLRFNSGLTLKTRISSRVNMFERLNI